MKPVFCSLLLCASFLAVAAALASEQKNAKWKADAYAELGKATAKAIPNSTLVEFDDMGHAPQIQDPKRFHEALLKGLADLKH